MPRLGSLTQRPRAPTRWGANVWPLAGQGRVRLAALTQMEWQPAPRLDWAEDFGSLGHSMPQPMRMRAPTFTGSFNLAPGVTRDSAGAPLGGCDVYVFRVSAFNEFLGLTTSDGSGNWSFRVPDNSGTFWAVAYKSGAPDLAGMTIRGLTASG